jgi:hypothetical protein
MALAPFSTRPPLFASPSPASKLHFGRGSAAQSQWLQQAETQVVKATKTVGKQALSNPATKGLFSLVMEGVALKSVGAFFRYGASVTGVDPIKPKEVLLREGANLGILAGISYLTNRFVKGSHFKLLMVAYVLSEAVSWGLVVLNRLGQSKPKQTALQGASVEQPLQFSATHLHPKPMTPTSFALAPSPASPALWTPLPKGVNPKPSLAAFQRFLTPGTYAASYPKPGLGHSVSPQGPSFSAPLKGLTPLSSAPPANAFLVRPAGFSY